MLLVPVSLFFSDDGGLASFHRRVLKLFGIGAWGQSPNPTA